MRRTCAYLLLEGSSRVDARRGPGRWALLKAVLLNLARPASADRPFPNDTEGWGFLDSLDGLLPGEDGSRLRLWNVREGRGPYASRHTR